MKRVVISQPRYLPSPAYLYRFALADEFIYLDTVQYSPRDWENRNRIRNTSGSQWLSVPIIKSDKRQKIYATQIDNSTPWQKKHLNSLHLNYAKTPFFDMLYPRLEKLLGREWDYLCDLNMQLCKELLDILGFQCSVLKASSLKPSGQGAELLLNLCKEQEADVYLSGPLGKNYIDTDLFTDSGVICEFHHFSPQPYPQSEKTFIPNLSSVDLLFNQTAEQCRQYMRKCSQIESEK